MIMIIIIIIIVIVRVIVIVTVIVAVMPMRTGSATGFVWLTWSKSTELQRMACAQLPPKPKYTINDDNNNNNHYYHD